MEVRGGGCAASAVVDDFAHHPIPAVRETDRSHRDSVFGGRRIVAIFEAEELHWR
jgi:UDP-N-acetylmuramate-alanine ligase